MGSGRREGRRRLLPLAVYGFAMGYLEAAVVVYLRQIHYPEGFSFPLAAMSRQLLSTEIGREAATLIMIVAVAWLAGCDRWRRLLSFAFVFGIWDIVYYVGLKVLLDWPSSLLEADVLFLIPTVWVGPILAPLLIACSFSCAAFLLWPWPYSKFGMRPLHWILITLAAFVLLGTFLWPAITGSSADLADVTHYRYPWLAYAMAIGVGWGVVVHVLVAGRSLRQPEQDPWLRDC